MTLAEMSQQLSNLTTGLVQTYSQIKAIEAPKAPEQAAQIGAMPIKPTATEKTDNKMLLIGAGVFVFIVGLFFALRRG